MSAPLWLEKPAMQALLHRLVDRLDDKVQKGKSSTHSFKLDNKSWPTFFDAEFEAEREALWSHLAWLAQQGWFDIKLNKSITPEADYERKPRLLNLHIERLRAAIGRLERVASAAELWRLAVHSTLHASNDIKQQIARSFIDIPGKSAEEIVERLNLLPALANAPLLLRQVSAELFWSKSKILDKRQELVATMLGLEECPFPLMPVQLQVFLPVQGYSGVLFIENQTTFEQAIMETENRFSGLAIVFAAGFKGSARRLRLRSGSSLYFSIEGDLSSAATSLFVDWLYNDGKLRSWFWGDLDYAGMGILQTLRNSFGNLEAWQPGYIPMLEALQNNGGHSPENIQKKVEYTGCSYADNVLLPALHKTSKFIDQEMA